MSHLPYCPSVSLSFKDISYSIEDGLSVKIPILRSLSGNFSSGQLVAIMGPSGMSIIFLKNSLQKIYIVNLLYSHIRRRKNNTFEYISWLSVSCDGH